MQKILDTVVTDHRAWNKASFGSPKDNTYSLSSQTLEELRQSRQMFQRDIDVYNTTPGYDVSRFPKLEQDITRFCRESLDHGSGFFLIDRLSEFSGVEQKNIYLVIASVLGNLLVQNKQGERIVEVKDRGATMQEGGRYHQTKQGGSLHTDSPYTSEIPDYLGLLCIHPSIEGGLSRLISAHTIHNRILQLHSQILKVLYQPFHFDKRGGEFKPGENSTTFEPIFKFDNEGLHFRYLRDYIDPGHKIAGQPLTPQQIEALDVVDNLLQDENLMVELGMEEGHMQFVNNHRIVHGRTAFEDHDEPEKKRVMLRTWIKKKVN